MAPFFMFKIIEWLSDDHQTASMSTDPIFERLLEKLESFQHLSINFKQTLRPLLKLRHLATGEILLRYGSRNNNIWFMYEGFAREIAHEEQNEWTSWFYFAGDFMFSYPSLFSHLPAFRDIEMITIGEVLEISYSNLLMLRNKFPELITIVDLARDECEMERARYASCTHTLNAKERYERFFKDHKMLFNVARHKDIASFLGIKSDGLRRYIH